jgi:hypothetical protein
VELAEFIPPLWRGREGAMQLQHKLKTPVPEPRRSRQGLRIGASWHVVDKLRASRALMLGVALSLGLWGLLYLLWSAL